MIEVCSLALAGLHAGIIHIGRLNMVACILIGLVIGLFSIDVRIIKALFGIRE